MREVGTRQLKAKVRGLPQATVRDAWARLLGLAEGMAEQPGSRKSVVRELERMRR